MSAPKAYTDMASCLREIEAIYERVTTGEAAEEALPDLMLEIASGLAILTVWVAHLDETKRNVKGAN